MPGLHAALFPRGPSLSALTAGRLLQGRPSLMLHYPDVSGTEKIVTFTTQLSSSFMFSLSRAFSCPFSTTPISKLSPANSLLHSYRVASGHVRTSLLEDTESLPWAVKWV